MTEATAQPLSANMLLLDLDGTLVDSAAAIDQAWHQWAEEFDVASPDLTQALGGTSEATVAALIPEERRAAALAAIHRLELETVGNVTAVPGAPEKLAALSSTSWCMVTSSRRDVALSKLQVAGLPVPTLMVCADDYADSKPAPDAYAAAVKLTGTPPAQCLAFEDSMAGIAASEAAGVRVIAVATYDPPSALDTPFWISDWRQVRLTQIVSSRTVTVEGIFDKRLLR